MCVLETQRCLVLNKGWMPVGTLSLKKALLKLFTENEDGEPKARIIDAESYQVFSWDDWSKIRPNVDDETIRSANLHFKIPEVILLSSFDGIPKPKVQFNRRNLFKRDKMMCQYCGARPGSQELTIDHVQPKSKGGETSWENCVLSCQKCNSRKANRTPEQAKMKLRKKPAKPRPEDFQWESTRPMKSWKAFISEMYWNVELENDMKDDE